MYKLFYALLIIVWILDMLNMPFMAGMDTTVPINGLAWTLILMLVPMPTEMDRR